MTFKPKRWRSLGVAVFGAAALTACGGEAGEGESGEGAPVDTTSAAYAGEGEGEGGEGEGEVEGEGGQVDIGALPLPNRLAFMTGHVEAGLALYRAGEPEMAAPHLLHPVSETHAAERAGLDALGFDPSLFETVSAALEAGTAAADVEAQLTAAETHLQSLAADAGGDPAEIIRFLLTTTREEYAIGVRDGAVVNAGEYQDAFGFVVVARDRLVALAETRGDDAAIQTALSEVEALLALWPEAPVPPETPTPLSEIAAQIARVELELSGVR